MRFSNNWSRAAAMIFIALSPVLMGASECGSDAPKAPKAGVVIAVVPEARACYDQQDATVWVEYQPDGTDPQGAPWPRTGMCVTPAAGFKLTPGGRVQG